MATTFTFTKVNSTTPYIVYEDTGGNAISVAWQMLNLEVLPAPTGFLFQKIGPFSYVNCTSPSGSVSDLDLFNKILNL